MRCPICQQPVAHLENHHIIPREYGGVDLQTVDICSTCHHGLHHQANHIWAQIRNPGREPKHFFTQEVWSIAEPYVRAILQARQNHEQLGKPQVHKRRVIVHVSDDTLGKLHRLKKYRGYRSLERFLRDHLEELTSLM